MTLPAWYPAFAAASIVLVLAGMAKVVRPHDTARALRATGVPASAAVVRLGSLAEVGIGLWALTTGSRIAAGLVTISYLAFAAFVAQALVRRLPLATCGCLGEPDTPPTAVHVVLDIGLAAAASVAIARPVTSAWHELGAHPAQGIVLIALVAVAVHLVVTALAAWPRVMPGAPTGARR